jgi:tetratricopeptide (TPR) repeat protein
MSYYLKHLGRRLAAPAAALLLLLAPHASAGEEEEFLELMNQYLSLGNMVVDTAERPEGSIFLAIEGIFEIYEDRRDAPGAIKHFENLLREHGNNLAVRNLIRFKLRDIYKETGQVEKALEQLDAIVAENAAKSER